MSTSYPKLVLLATCLLLACSSSVFAECSRECLREKIESAPSDSLRSEYLNKLSNSYLYEDPTLMLKYARAAYIISHSTGSEVLKGRSRQKMGIAYAMVGETDSSLVALQESQQYFEEGNHPRGKIEALTNLANIYFVQGEYVEAQQAVLEIFQEIEAQDVNGNFDVYRISPVITSGNIKVATGDYEEATRDFKEALGLAKKFKNQQANIPLIVNNLASVYNVHLGQPDSAIYYLESVVDLPGLEHNVQAKVHICLNLGDLYEKQSRDGSRAKRWYQRALDLSQERGFDLQLPTILIRMTKWEMQQGNFEKAALLLDSTETIFREKDNLKGLLDIMRMRVSLDSLQGDLQAALSNSRLEHNLRDSLLGADKQVEIQSLQQKIDLIAKDFEIKSLEREKELDQKRSQMKLLLLGGLALLGIGMGIYQYQLMRKNRSLARAEAELRSSSEALLQAQLQQQAQEKAYLEKEIEFKSQRLTDFATHLALKKQLVSDISAAIKEHATGPARDSLTALLRQIQPQLRLDNDQKDLELYVERTHQNLLLALDQHFQGLTKGERKLAAMIRMGLSAKEISHLLGINPKSVEMNRYRLRKKIGISSGVDLKAFLSEIEVANPESNQS